MNFIRTLILLILICRASITCAADEQSEPDRFASVNLILERAISDNLIAGGVVAVGNQDGVIATMARGRMDVGSNAPQINENTIFDLASLTKVIATTPAVMKLLDKRKLSLSDPISHWFPEFKRRRGNITIIHLLTHTSGLSDFQLNEGQSMKSVIRKAAAERHRPPPGLSFHYADINFIILGELVRRISGNRLDEFCRDHIFKPLGAQDTMFLPPREIVDNIAPTLGQKSGTVQDSNARCLGSIAGHAGLFSTALDLSRFARMLLGKGVIDGTRILSERAVTKMTTPYLCSNRGVIRSPGWDMESPYSAPKGENFSEYSYGHTGYSGSSIWIDPKLDLFVVLLTNRLDYSDTDRIKQLRRDISTSVVATFKPSGYNSSSTEVAELLRAMAKTLPVTYRSKKNIARLSKRHLVALNLERKKHGMNHRRRRV